MPRPKPRGAANPIIAALIADLPQPGTTWPLEGRQRWLSAVQAAFNLVYAVEKPQTDVPPRRVRLDHDVEGRTYLTETAMSGDSADDPNDPEMLSD